MPYIGADDSTSVASEEGDFEPIEIPGGEPRHEDVDESVLDEDEEKDQIDGNLANANIKNVQRNGSMRLSYKSVTSSGASSTNTFMTATDAMDEFQECH